MKMSSPYITLGNRPLEQWKVTELREELKKRKLTTKGLKEDLLKRLDEAVRSEQADAAASLDVDATQSDLPSEPENKKEKDEDRTDISTAVNENPDAKPDHEVDDRRNAKSDLGNEGKTSEIEQQPVESVVLSGSSLHTDGKSKDDDSSAVVSNKELLPFRESAKVDDSDPIEQPLPVSESMDKAPSIEPTVQGPETQNEAIDTMETDDSKSLQPDSSAQPYQVSEVNPDLGSQVTSDSVNTESGIIVEKDDLKIGVITDNVKIDLDVKHEMGQTYSNDAGFDGGKLDAAVDIDEPLDKKDTEQIHDKVVSAKVTNEGNDGNVDNLKNIDSVDLGATEKLSLDRSSGDDSMEEDVLDSKQSEVKSDPTKYHDSVEDSGKPITNEDDHVDVVGHDKPIELKTVDTENETVSGPGFAKRKFNDNEAMGHNESAKKARRWNTDGAKDSEQQSGNVAVSVTPKGSSEPVFKRTGSDLAVNEETPKERVVPPSSKPPTNSLRIDRFLRPFTLKAVQELLGKTGTVTSFWMDHIKTHCYVSYSSVEEAVETRNSVYNLQWPPNGGRLLVAEFVDPQEVKNRLEAPPVSPATTPSSSAAANFATTKLQAPALAPPQPSPRQQMSRQQLPPPPPPQLTNPPLLAKDRGQPPLPARDRLNLPPPPPIPEKVDLPIVTLDDLFRKTKATPRIYYLPLSDEQVAAKLKSQGKNVNP